jgi:hypothetical protein
LLISRERNVLQRDNRLDGKVGVKGDRTVGIRSGQRFGNDEYVTEDEKIPVFDGLRGVSTVSGANGLYSRVD